MGETYKALSGAKILVVDDEISHLQSLERVLIRHGCAVTTASCVPDAIRAIEQEAVGFHAGIVDYRLLDRPGSEVVMALSRAARFTASLVLTGQPTKQMLDDSYRVGVHNTLTKPVPLGVLLPELQGCIDRTLRVRWQYQQGGQKSA